MTNEIWDIFDSDGKLTGKTTVRGSCSLKRGEYHLVVHIWVVSRDGRFLIQRRSDQKKLMPGEWAATGGAAISGEDSFTAASRELFEELGIPSTKQSLTLLTRIKRRNSLLDVWVITSDASLDELKLQKSEVAEARWISRSDLQKMIENGQYHNYGEEYFGTVFEKIDNYLGALV